VVGGPQSVREEEDAPPPAAATAGAGSSAPRAAGASTAAAAAAAAVAPPPGGPSCFLVFSESSQGSLFTHWSSQATMEGALASFVPTKAVPKFKLTANGGKSELVRDLQSNKKKVFEGFCGFARMAKSFAAPVAFLQSIESVRVAMYAADTSLGITRVGADPVPLSDKLVIACVPEGCSSFNGVQSMDTALFQQTGAKMGAALML
jgi:hypothetical protein